MQHPLFFLGKASVKERKSRRLSCFSSLQMFEQSRLEHRDERRGNINASWQHAAPLNDSFYLPQWLCCTQWSRPCCHLSEICSNWSTTTRKKWVCHVFHLPKKSAKYLQVSSDVRIKWNRIEYWSYPHENQVGMTSCEQQQTSNITYIWPDSITLALLHAVNQSWFITCDKATVAG